MVTQPATTQNTQNPTGPIVTRLPLRSDRNRNETGPYRNGVDPDRTGTGAVFRSVALNVSCRSTDPNRSGAGTGPGGNR